MGTLVLKNNQGKDDVSLEGNGDLVIKDTEKVLKGFCLRYHW